MLNLNASKVKKALVVDDSAFMRKLISDYLNSHPAIEVIGIARNGKDAIEKIQSLKPDVVTLDIEMPLMNGLDALQIIMNKFPVPVVMLSSTTKVGAENTMQAMEYGAVDFVAKPGGAISLNLDDVKEEIIKKVLAASEVQISQLKSKLPNNPNHLSHTGRKYFSEKRKTFVMIGTSTGGPRALQEVLTKLPKNLQASVLIVQHMPAGFTKSLADRLDGLCEITVKEAEDGEALVNGTAYIAAGGKHMKIKKKGNSHIVFLDDVETLRSGHRPSVDVLFESVAELTDINFLTVIMTGMGSDGKLGTKLLKENSETITIVESSETTVVYGMPKAIVDAGLADDIVKLQDLSKTIVGILKS